MTQFDTSHAPLLAVRDDEVLDVSVVMPCLNEARTVGTCIEKVHRAMVGSGLSYEVVIGDNGSTDGSQAIAKSANARVVDVTKRGYGNAYRGAIAQTRGRMIVIGDSDDSYDFLSVPTFVAKVSEGYDLVMGSRFKGGIEPGAMPPLHRYLGNPVLTGVLNLFFRAGISDAHCGMRAFTREAFERMDLKTGGMEFASEMVIRATQVGLRIGEIPTTLNKDGRGRPPHLRSWHDGWRHLRFMLLFSPLWLFLIPGAMTTVVGLLLVGLLPFVDVALFGHVLSYHFSIAGSLLTILGITTLQLAVFAKAVLAGKRLGRSAIGAKALRSLNLETALVTGIAVGIVGAALIGFLIVRWVASDFGAMTTSETSLMVLGATMVVVGVQFVFSAFFLGVLRGALTDVWVD